jgi:hypothetical protein
MGLKILLHSDMYCNYSTWSKVTALAWAVVDNYVVIPDEWEISRPPIGNLGSGTAKSLDQPAAHAHASWSKGFGDYLVWHIHLPWPSRYHNSASEPFLAILVGDSEAFMCPLLFRRTCQKVLRPGSASEPLFPVHAHSGLLWVSPRPLLGF